MLEIGDNGIIKSLYRVFKTGWGIYINLSGEIVSYANNSDNKCIKIIEGLWVSLPDTITKDDVLHIRSALVNVSNAVILASPYKSDTLIIFYSIEYNPCDYQSEGFVPAIYQWISEALKIEMPELEVNYNRAKNKYEFY